MVLIGHGLVCLMGTSIAALLSLPDMPLLLRKCLVLSTTFFTAGRVRVLWTKNAYDLAFAFLLAGALLFLLRALDHSGVSQGGGIARIIRFAADYSFTLYLVHYSVLFILAPLGKTVGPYVGFTVAVILSNGIVATLALVTEMHHRQLTSYLLRQLGIHPQSHKTT